MKLKLDQIDCLEINKKRITNLEKVFIKSKNINFFSNINYLKKKYDVAIDATTSSTRFKILDKIINKSKIDNLLVEKFLFQNFKVYFKFQNIIKKKKIKTFINCPMRTYEAFSFIKKKLVKKILFLK